MNFINWLLTPWRVWRANVASKRRIKALRERDPFIYK